MTFGIYSIRDQRTGFLAPTVEVSDAVAQRNFSHAVQSATGPLRTFAAEYDLYKIGELDNESGMISPVAPPEFIMSASSAIIVKE